MCVVQNESYSRLKDGKRKENIATPIKSDDESQFNRTYRHVII